VAQGFRTHLAAYRRDGDWWLVEIRLRDVRQMFHSLDPAPFREKDLDPAAEDYLEEAVRDIGPTRPIRLRIHLPAAALGSEDARTLPEAIARHFDYRAAQAGVDLRRLLGRGGVSLAIGLGFLVLCLWLRAPIAGDPRYAVLAEGLLIIGWVGLWRPVEIFLYDWWPVRRRLRRFAALSRMPVEVAAGAP
jgi:hypothetical protein